MNRRLKNFGNLKHIVKVAKMLVGVSSTSKTQIDQLGNRLRKGEASDEDVRLLEDYRLSFAEAYEEVIASIQRAVQLAPTGRPAKLTSSIIAKLRREKTRLSRMQDIAGCRVVVRDVLAQDQVGERLRGELAGAKVIDRRKQPSNGYRAVHLIATARNKLIEIQVRTELQHLWAQLSEKLADAGDPAIKYGGGDFVVRQLLSGLSDIIAGFEELESPSVPAGLPAEVDQLKRKIRQMLENAVRF